MKYRVAATSRFTKDSKRLAAQGADMRRLAEVIDLLASGEPMPSKYEDHPLKGDLDGARECHVAPDWLLIYIRDKNKLVLLLQRTGSHSRLLKR